VEIEITTKQIRSMYSNWLWTSNGHFIKIFQTFRSQKDGMCQLG